MMTRAPLAILLTATFAALAGCPDGGGSTPPDSTDAADSRGEDESGSVLDGRCGAAGLRFEDLRWMPKDVRLATRVDLEDPSLDIATENLAAVAEDPAASVPVVASLDYRQLGLQLGLLGPIVRALGSEPGELVELLGPDGELIWIWPTDCPADSIAARMLGKWQLAPRASLEFPGTRVAVGNDAFPFDVVTIADRHMALARRGQGQAALAWLRTPREGPASAADALGELEAAAIRSVLVGEWLLSTSDDARSADAPPEDAPPTVRTVRATADGVELDGKPWPPP